MASEPPRFQQIAPASENDLAVQFSDSRFLRQVLLEATRSGSQGAAATAKKLEGMGFGPEVVKVALHVAGGDEHKAMQLCMSGLSFVGAGSGEHLENCAPPAPLRCYICGRKYLTDKSLDIHVKSCRKRFELREAKRPPGERRPLLEEAELPDGVACLERHYEVMDGMYGGIADSMLSTPFESWVEKRQPAQDPSKLLPCEFCKRTFLPERLGTHQRACLQRPKVQAEAKQPARRRSICASGPPAAAVNAYNAFCNQLERCPSCARQFRPELLEAHCKVCCAAKPPAKASSSKPSRASPTRSKSPAGWGTLRAASDRQQLSTPKAARSRSSGTTGSIAFTPPSRYVPIAGSPNSPGGGTSPAPVARRRSSGSVASSGAASAPPESVPAAVPCSASLLVKGLLAEASAEDASRLYCQLAERLPDVELAGIFEVVNVAQRGVYEALASSMHAQGPPAAGEEDLLLERELWHGTSWTLVPKILKQGFNRSFAGKHGTLLGHATYFSSDPAYSLRFCDRHGGGADGTKVLLVSKVFVGSHCKGSPSDVEPPLRDRETGDRFDSTVDNEENPSIFAVFRDFQAVPLFLVEVKVRSASAKDVKRHVQTHR
eukprot:TRINITY_DN20994_c0_g1_i1.p1 TRINITY_DN20994_c0_g1~~TRINITY_DN20994_c0_g1_i1.p1  ORF type:complete len:614 (-),score=128.49 TRINITY_DN20994_c0_g1_i1:61-1872(-)